ncbi:MAG: cation transporter, partial [Acidobacteria bacterium]|nr:cation transporter [Acidobacteriota bacterium]
YHGVRFRNSGMSLWIELHLLFPGSVSIEEAHRKATRVEQVLQESLPLPAQVTTHLESEEDHSRVHPEPHYEGKP